jgi:hypothetical protein
MSIEWNWPAPLENRRFSAWCRRGQRFTIVEVESTPNDVARVGGVPLSTIGGMEVVRTDKPGEYLIKRLGLIISEAHGPAQPNHLSRTNDGLQSPREA